MDYPEHEKLKLVRHKTQFVHDFLEQCGEEGVGLCRATDNPNSRGDSDYCPIHRTERDKILYEFIQVDPNKLEKERVQMLDECRKNNKKLDKNKKRKAVKS
jgi:hypothetical protein